jgi:LysM repeat protein
MSDMIYTVVSGDTATKITKKFNISLDVFKKLNPTIKDVNKISIGQKVKVGEEVIEELEVFNENNYYFVKSGDTINQIVELFETTTNEIKRLNPDITDINKIYAGQILKIAEHTDYDLVVYEDEYTPIGEMDRAIKIADGSFKFDLKSFSDDDLSGKFYEVHTLQNGQKTLLQSGYLDEFCQTSALKTSADTPILLTLQIHDDWIVTEDVENESF